MRKHSHINEGFNFPSSFILHPSSLGFTLIEMVLALGILGILLVVGQSAIRIAGHSLPDANSPTFSAGNGQRALAQLTSELSYANGVTQMSANSVTFTVAPRGSDGSNETITYAWDGTAGDPLTRQYNSDPAVNVATNVNAFSMLYDKRSVPAATTYGTSAQTLLYTDDTGGTAVKWGLSDNSGYVNNMSQSFTPTLPDNASTWNVSKIVFKAKQDNYPGGQFAVQIRTSFSGIPSQNVVQQATVNGSSLSGSASWYTVNFPTPATLPAGIESALNLQWISDAYRPPLLNLLGLVILGGGYFPPADIYCQSTSSSPVMAVSNDGNNWSSLSGYAMTCYIYGTCTTPDPPTYNYYLQNVRASLQLGNDPNAAVRTGIPVLNQPQVVGP